MLYIYIWISFCKTGFSLGFTYINHLKCNYIRPAKNSLNSTSTSRTTFSTSIQHFQDFLREKPSRKLLQEALFSQPPMLASPSPSGGTTYPSSELYTGHRLVPNIVSVIMFGPICNIGSLVLYTIIKNASQ